MRVATAYAVLSTQHLELNDSSLHHLILQKVILRLKHALIIGLKYECHAH